MLERNAIHPLTRQPQRLVAAEVHNIVENSDVGLYETEDDDKSPRW